MASQKSKIPFSDNLIPFSQIPIEEDMEDDDTLKEAQKAGLKLDEDYENPKPLDIAGDVDKAEKYHRDH